MYFVLFSVFTFLIWKIKYERQITSLDNYPGACGENKYMYILELNLAIIKIKNQNIVLVYVIFPQRKILTLWFHGKALHHFPVVRKNTAVIFLYIYEKKNYFTFTLVFWFALLIWEMEEVSMTQELGSVLCWGQAEYGHWACDSSLIL